MKRNNRILQFINRKSGDILMNAIYDVVKYVFPAFLIFISLQVSPAIRAFLSNRLTLSYFQFLIVISTCVVVTILVYFLLNRSRFAVIKKDLRTDELTTLLNHRALNEDLIKMIGIAKKENAKLSVLLIDIDDFKKFNNVHGQHVADSVLKKFAFFLKSDSRVTDSVYRQHMKGDEFIIIAKDTDLNSAIRAANRKRDLIAATGIEIDGMTNVFYLTVCCGVTEMQPSDNESRLVERAFSALLMAKQAVGKNTTSSLI